jgi:hypothetical protein
MEKYKVGRYIVFAVLGFLIFAGGLVLKKLWTDAEGIMKSLPYICVGLGSGVMGGNIGTAMKNRALLKNPEAAKLAEISEKDERNQVINNKAKARVYDMMIFVYSAMLLAFALMQIELYVTLILVAIYLFFILSYVYYLRKYNKEM